MTEEATFMAHVINNYMIEVNRLKSRLINNTSLLLIDVRLYVDPAPMRLLVVEDDPKIASFIVKGFKESGFAVDHYANGAEALNFALVEPYSAIILDIMLPGLDGLSLVQELRKKKVETPVLLLSAKSTWTTG